MLIQANKSKALTIAALAVIIFGFAIIENAWAGSKNWKPSLKMTRLPVFPETLIDAGVTKGHVQVAVALSEDGSLIDWLPVEATHREMAISVARVIENWDFEGLRTLNEPRGEAYLLNIDFEAGGRAFATSSPLELSKHIFGPEKARHPQGIRQATLEELDALPTPIHIEQPFVPVELRGHDRQEVVFEFYIDTEGRVHIPLLKSTETELDERILLSSQNALWNWRFFPPTSNGYPVVVKVAQPLVFSVATNGP